jgi:peptidoglycan/LPS O-acetylase OafA/YrhL
MKMHRFFARLPQGVSRRQTILPAHVSDSRLSKLGASGFNLVASIVLVVVSSVVMARLVVEDHDTAATFAPFYVVTLFVIGGFLFSGREGKWINVKVVIQMLSIFVVLPLGILLYAAYCVNSPPPINPFDRLTVTNASWPQRRDLP